MLKYTNRCIKKFINHIIKQYYLKTWRKQYVFRADWGQKRGFSKVCSNIK